MSEPDSADEWAAEGEALSEAWNAMLVRARAAIATGESVESVVNRFVMNPCVHDGTCADTRKCMDEFYADLRMIDAG